MDINVGVFSRRSNCRVCGSERLYAFLDLGLMPLAGGFLHRHQLSEERVYPLDVVFCSECSLVQVPNVVAAEKLFSDYRYLSSVTQSLVAHFEAYARRLAQLVAPIANPFILEFGCNDGVLLAPLSKLGVRVLGVDPADNVTERARARGIEVVSGFFSAEAAQSIASSHGQPNVITASNVFAHIDDLHEIMRGVSCLLAPAGVFAVEVHYVLDLLDGCQFDTIYHEHLCYYSLNALAALYKRYDMVLIDAERLPMHGGAIRVLAQRSSEAAGPSQRLSDLLELEARLGIADADTYSNFGTAVTRTRERIRELLFTRLAKGRRLSGYGASGRATILLNYCGIDSSMMDFIVDASPFRYGRLVPGVHIPVEPPAAFRDHHTDDCLVTAWNYSDEILSKERDYLKTAGRAFILPLPEPRIMQGTG